MPRVCPPSRRPTLFIAGAVLALIGGAGHGRAFAQGPVPQPEAAGAPPMYIGEPFPSGGGGLAGTPNAVAVDMLPSWPRWFAGASGLLMTRTLESGAATMQPLGGVQLSTADAGASWPGGVDLHIGRWVGPRQHHAVEFIYWGVYGIGSTATVAAAPPAIQAIPQAAADVLVAGLPAPTFLSGASAQSITRSDLVNDVEINWVYALWDRPEFLPRERMVSLMWLAGFRFFQVEDVLTLATTAGDPALGAADLTVATNNNLYGGQVGAKFDWRFLPSVRLAVVPKILLAGNAITNTTTLASSTGAIATFPGDVPVGVHSTLGVFSWLGSVDTGIAWDVTDHWTLSLGYRVVGVGNIAQADGQWPSFIATPDSLSGLSAGSSTILHGGYAGFEGRY